MSLTSLALNSSLSLFSLALASSVSLTSLALNSSLSLFSLALISIQLTARKTLMAPHAVGGNHWAMAEGRDGTGEMGNNSLQSTHPTCPSKSGARVGGGALFLAQKSLLAQVMPLQG